MTDPIHVEGGGVAPSIFQPGSGEGGMVTKAMLLEIPPEKLTPQMNTFIKGLPDGALSKADLDAFMSNISSLSDLFKLGGYSPLAAAIIADTVASASGDGVPDTMLGKQIKFLRETIANPELFSPDAKEAIKALTKAMDGDHGKGMHYNNFLGGLVGVAIMEAMMEYMKTQQVGEKISSEMWLAVEDQTLEMADAIAKNIEDKAQKEAMQKIATAILSAGTCVVNLAGFGVGLGKGGGMMASQQIKMATEAFNTALTGVANNMVGAVFTIQIGHLDAEKVIMETQKDILGQMMSKIKEQGDDYAKNFDSFNEALKAWMTKLSEASGKITAH